MTLFGLIISGTQQEADNWVINARIDIHVKDHEIKAISHTSEDLYELLKQKWDYAILIDMSGYWIRRDWKNITEKLEDCRILMYCPNTQILEKAAEDGCRAVSNFAGNSPTYLIRDNLDYLVGEVF